MKKFTVLTLIGLLILAFGVTAYSQEKAPVLEFKPSGFIYVITEWNKNVSGPPNAGKTGNDAMFQAPSAYLPTGAAFDKTQGYMEQRARLKFEAIMGKEVSGTIFFEMDSTKWGERSAVGSVSATESGTLGAWGGDKVAVEIKNLFITFAVPGMPIPVTLQAGLQPLAVRSGHFLSTDATGVVATAKIDPATIRLIWAKANENLVYSSDDVDVYGVDVSATIEKFTIGGYGVNYNMNTYPFQTADISTLTNQANVWWLGLYADGKAGPVDINFDFGYDTGKVESKATPTAHDVKYTGWASRLKVDYPWEKFNFGLVGMYASGADQKKTSATGLPGSTVANGTAASTKVDAYVVPPGSEANYNDGFVFYASTLNEGNTSFLTAASTQMARRFYGGTWFAKLYGSYKATPTYKITLQGLYIGDTTKNGNTIGNAVKSDGTPRDDKSIGFELDVINEIQIYKSLTFSFGGGMLFAGDAMDYLYTGTTNKSPKNPWAVASKLRFDF